MSRRPRLTLAGGLLLAVMGVAGLAAPLLANDRPLVLAAARGISFPAAGELPLLGRLAEEPAWRSVDWSLPQPGERWRLAAPIPHSFRGVDLAGRFSPPSRRHLLGTDALGRDLAARILHGAAISFQVALGATGLAFLIGVLLGAMAGFTGGWADAAISRSVEILLAFPTFFLLLAVLAFLPPSLAVLVLVMGLTRWPSLARYTRAQVMSVRERPHVEAARAGGAGRARLLILHILPLALTPALVAASFQLSGAMLVEAGLSFLGFGAPEPLASWGSLLAQAQGSGRWWLVVFPGLALTLAVTAAQMVGEGFRERLDPRAARL